MHTFTSVLCLLDELQIDLRAAGEFNRFIASVVTYLSHQAIVAPRARNGILGSISTALGKLSPTFPEPMLQTLGSIPIRSFTADAIRWVHPR